jgi:hypothetical protein
MLFVNAHFSAHQEQVERRNSDFDKICLKLNLRPPITDDSALQSVTDRFERVFWLGDLNYRVNANRRIADALIQAGDLDVLRANDQLLQEKAHGHVFVGFTEGPLAFPPTYKYDADSDAYDSSPKQRVPSWTDRVLWKPRPEIRLLEYTSVPSIRTSDHRPVRAAFAVTVSVGRAKPPRLSLESNARISNRSPRPSPVARPDDGAEAEARPRTPQPSPSLRAGSPPVPGLASPRRRSSGGSSAAAAQQQQQQQQRSEKNSAVCAVQ